MQKQPHVVSKASDLDHFDKPVMLYLVLHINQNFCYIISTLFQTEKTLQQQSFTSMEEEEEGGMGGGGLH